MSTSQRNFHVYNPKIQSSEASFPQFARLPLDLRLCVWDTALVPKERFLRVRLRAKNSAERVTPDDSSHVDDDYQISLKGRKLVSKFLHICQDARRVALAFYRVRLPCRYEHAGISQEGTFYFNPEHDILQVAVGKHIGYAHRIRFFQDLHAADPKGVGLENLAINTNDVRCFSGGLRRHARFPSAREILTRTLSKLRKVYLVCLENTQRLVDHNTEWMVYYHVSGATQRHRLRPVRGCIPTFARIPVDHRPIDEQLRRELRGMPDLLDILFSWKRLLRLHSIAGRVDIEYSWMVACSPRHHAAISDWDSAEQYIVQEEAKWQDAVEGWNQHFGRRGGKESEKSAGLQNDAQAAIGFWLFPIQAFADFLPPDMGHAEDLERDFDLGLFDGLDDLSNYTPQLGLMEIA